MKFLTRQTITCAFLICCSSVFTLKSQTVEKTVSTGSVSGTVTLKGKGAPGITVVLRKERSEETSYQAKTDQDGLYRIINVPPGIYMVTPDSPQFVVSSRTGNATLILSDGETVGDINFTLTKGGVITGRVTNSDGQPLIEQRVGIRMIEVTPNNTGEFNAGFRQSQSQTDDRGVYRIFGLPPGKYIVSAGERGRSIPGGGQRHSIPTTYYPDVNDMSKATSVEVSEGGESTNIDIKVGVDDTSPKFSVSGRVVDGTTGQPVSNLRVQVVRYSNESQDFKPGLVNAEGQFKVEGLPQGKYQLYIQTTADVELRADSAPFDIIEGDVNGLVVKTFKGVSVSGQIILEGGDNSSQAKLKNLAVMVSVQHSMGGEGRGAEVRPDGSFHVGRLPEGTLSFEVSQGYPQKQLGISRIERDGMVQLRGIEVKEGDQITGVRVFVNSSNGTIRGVVKFENGEARPGQISLELISTDPMRGQRLGLRPPEIDARGRFLMQGVPAGTYELNVRVYPLRQGRRVPTTKQQVTVTDGAVSEVTIIVDLSPGP